MTTPSGGFEVKKAHYGLGGLSIGIIAALLGLLTQINGVIDDRIKQNAEVIRTEARQEILGSQVIKEQIKEAVETRAQVFASEAGGIRDQLGGVKGQLSEMKNLIESLRRDVGDLKIALARNEGPQGRR